MTSEHSLKLQRHSALQRDAVQRAEIAKLRLEDKNKLEKREEEEGKNKKKHDVVRGNIILR